MSNIEIILAILAFIPLYIDLSIRFWRHDKISFLLLRVRTESSKPIESSWSIRILAPLKLTFCVGTLNMDVQTLHGSMIADPSNRKVT